MVVASNKKHLSRCLLAKGYSHQNNMNGRVKDISSHGRKPPFLDTNKYTYNSALCSHYNDHYVRHALFQAQENYNKFAYYYVSEV
jgi:hypothetical protein